MPNVKITELTELASADIAALDMLVVVDVSDTTQAPTGTTKRMGNAVTADAAQTLTNKTLTAPAISNPTGLDSSDVGLGNVENKSSATIRSEITSLNVTTALTFTPEPALGFVPEDSADKGAAGGYAPLGGDSLVPSIYLPSYIDDVVEYANYAALPVTGVAGIIYITIDNNNQYRWTGTVYVQLTASPGTTDAVPEGVSNLYFTIARVRDTLLAGLSLVTSTAITAADSVLVAFGKLQAQITVGAAALAAHIADVANPHAVTKTQVGLSAVENTALSTWAGTASITTLGTIGTGTWQGTVLAGAYGGTGVANTGKTITIGGNIAYSGAFAGTFTLTATTAVTFPTTGTLATLAGAEAFTNKTYTSPALGNSSMTGLKSAHYNSQIGTSGTTGATTVDWSTGGVALQAEPTGAIVYTFTAPGTSFCHLQMIFDSDGTSAAFGITWPGTVIWYGQAITTTVANKKMLVTFWWDGTNYHAMGSPQV
jgi:hypothetical protein